MSGGHFNGYFGLCGDVTGYWPGYNLESEENRKNAELAARENKLADRQISEIAYDVFCLINSYDYWVCGDIREEHYRRDVDFFKRKWFQKPGVEDIERYIDRSMKETKDALLTEFGWIKGKTEQPGPEESG